MAKRCSSDPPFDSSGSKTPFTTRPNRVTVVALEPPGSGTPWHSTHERPLKIGPSPVSGDSAWQPRVAWDGATVHELVSRRDDELQTAMRGSAMRRTKVAGLRRNLVVSRRAIGAVDD